MHSHSINPSMPDPPEEFINADCPNYNVHGKMYAQSTDDHNMQKSNTKINTEHSANTTTERKLVPILKTPPTTHRENYNVERHVNLAQSN